jgi:hypothetical protein
LRADAAAADLSGDVSFFQRNLADDWTDGMSDGQFQTKKELISDLTDKAETCVLDRHAEEWVFVVLVVGSEGVLV